MRPPSFENSWFLVFPFSKFLWIVTMHHTLCHQNTMFWRVSNFPLTIAFEPRAWGSRSFLWEHSASHPLQFTAALFRTSTLCVALRLLLIGAMGSPRDQMKIALESWGRSQASAWPPGRDGAQLCQGRNWCVWGSKDERNKIRILNLFCLLLCF